MKQRSFGLASALSVAGMSLLAGSGNALGAPPPEWIIDILTGNPPPIDGATIYSCGGTAPLEIACSTGNHAWKGQLGLGIRLNCALCPFDGFVWNRITFEGGFGQLQCHIHSAGVATVFDCDIFGFGRAPLPGELLTHTCGTSGVSVGRWLCAYVEPA